MAYLWLGILSGLTLAYLIEMVGRRRGRRQAESRLQAREDDSLRYPERVRTAAQSNEAQRHQAPEADTVAAGWSAFFLNGRAVLKHWPAWIGWVLVVIFVILLGMTVYHGFHMARINSEFETGSFYRLTQNLIAPLVSGLLIGMVLAQLLVKYEWPFLTTLSGLGIALVLALLLTKDPSLSMLDQFKSASIAGVSLEFAGGSRPSSEEGAYSRVSVDFETNRTDYALMQLRDFTGLIERDKKYAEEAGLAQGPEGSPLERRFIERSVVTTFQMLWSARNLLPERDIWPLANRRLASDLRDAIMAKTGSRQQITSFKRLLGTLDELWSKLCERSTSVQECGHQRRSVRISGQRIALEMASRRGRRPVPIFNPNRPYGVFLSSLVQLMAGEEDAPVADLEAWLVAARTAAESEGSQSFRWIGLYRTYYLQSYLLARRQTNPVYLNATIESLDHAIRIGKMIIEESKWASKFSQAPCAAPTANPKAHEVLQRFRWAYVNALNNYAYLGSLNRDAMVHDRIFAATVQTAADAAVGVHWKCQGQPPQNALSFAIAAHETRTAVYLVIGGNAEGASLYNRQKAICTALESVNLAGDLIREVKRFPFQDPAHEQLFSRGQDKVRDALFRKYARDARRLADQLNAYEHCVGLKLRRQA